MKTIIAGGRNYTLSKEDYALLDSLLAEGIITEVVSGHAQGADLGGEHWAARNSVPVKRFPPDWGKHRRMAGPIRNTEMSQYAEAAVLFPGGSGTNDMYRKATAAGLKIYDFRQGGMIPE